MRLNIIGGGLSGCMLAYMARINGVDDVVIYEKNKIGGLCRDEEKNGLRYHPNGIHVFHTNNKFIWEFVDRFIKMNEFKFRAKIRHGSNTYSWPINEKTKKENKWTDKDIREMFINNYTEKMWNKPLDELGDSVKKRIRVNKGDCEDFFLDKYQGHPVSYNPLFEALTVGVPIVYTKVNVDTVLDGVTVCTAPVDEYFKYELGKLEWRGIDTKIQFRDKRSYQIEPMVNYPEKKYKHLRVVEFKKLTKQKSDKTVIGIDYPSNKKFYPVDTPRNNELYEKYKQLADENNVWLNGRLGTYSYMNMDECIKQSILLWNDHLYQLFY